MYSRGGLSASAISAIARFDKFVSYRIKMINAIHRASISIIPFPAISYGRSWQLYLFKNYDGAYNQHHGYSKLYHY
jgi:hypothetical protein